MDESNNKKYKILIVDDVAENLHSMVNILRDQYSLLVATNGAKAMELAASDAQPDLILLDIKMPGMDGYEVLQRLKSNSLTALIPVIFVTAMSEATDEARGLNLGAADYITKPVNADLLKRRVLTQLELKHYRKNPVDFGTDGKEMMQTFPSILVVDDVPENVHGLVSALSDEYRVLVAENGEKAIEIVNSANSPDLILLDIKMPGMDGYEVCQRIKATEKGESIPIIFLSILHEPIEKIRGFSIGAADYISKPFDIDEVHARIKTHLELRMYRQHLEKLVRTRTNELHESEKNFRQAQKMEALGTLVGGIAHDFNNILAGISGSTYLALHHSNNAPEAIEKQLNTIHDLTFRAADMVKQLLAFSRQEKVSRTVISLTSFAKEVSKLIRIGIEKNIKISNQFENTDLFVEANTTQLQQVLFNLINNARDAVLSENHPEIDLSLTRFEAGNDFMTRHDVTNRVFARIDVTDNGEGIPKENIERLFDPFFTTKDVDKGTGLGLTMVYSSIREHQGVVEVDSTAGKGSKFSVFLPIVEKASILEQHESDSILEGQGETILMVDDHPEILSTMKSIVSELGYTVLTASDGNEAMKVFQANKDTIELVLMDVVMPNMDGAEAARQMRALNSKIKIIFLTGYDSRGGITMQLKQKNEVLINKPCPVSYLSCIIREQLSG